MGFEVSYKAKQITYLIEKGSLRLPLILKSSP
jgi:hypothetical protein